MKFFGKIKRTYNFGSLLRLIVPSNLDNCRSTSSSIILSFDKTGIDGIAFPADTFGISFEV